MGDGTSEGEGMVASMTMIGRIERILFGATAQETVDMRKQLAANDAVERLIAALDVEPGYDEEYDRALTEALARGLERDEAHAEANRVADAWQAALRAGEPS